MIEGVAAHRGPVPPVVQQCQVVVARRKAADVNVHEHAAVAVSVGGSVPGLVAVEPRVGSVHLH